MLLVFLGWFCIIFGCALIISALIGMHKFPDLYTKVHAAGIIDSLGIPAIIFGIILIQHALKLMLIIIIMLVLNPVSTHSLINAAWQNGVKPLIHNKKDD